MSSVSRPARPGGSGGGLQLWQLALLGTHLAAAIVGYGYSRATAPAVAPVLLSRCGGAVAAAAAAAAQDDEATAPAPRQLTSSGGSSCGCGSGGSSLIPSVEAIRAYAADEAALPAPVVPLPSSLPLVVQALYRGPGGIVSPYTGFDASAWPQDMQGWNGEDNALRYLVAAANATAVIEVGAWKGQSSAFIASAMVEAAREREADTTYSEDAPPVEPFLLSVDTWQGAPEFLANRVGFHDEDRYLYTLHGWPLVYFQWLANMAHAGLQRVAFPLPAASLIAVEYLRRADDQFRADVIYVDGRCVEKRRERVE
jgi:hypothetical protein